MGWREVLKNNKLTGYYYRKLSEMYYIRGYKHINRGYIEKKLKANAFSGVVDKRCGTEQIIISLTSFPARIHEIKYTLHSLFCQTLPITAVVLCLSREEFPMCERDLPEDLLNLCQYGLEILWIEDNIRSYKKLIPAVQSYPDAIVISADDDLYYPSNWAEILYREHLKYPMDLIAHRAHYIEMDDNGNVLPYKNWNSTVKGEVFSKCRLFPTTGGGCLYPPYSLHEDFAKKDLFLRLSPYGDDIWFWAMVILNGRHIRVPKNNYFQITYVNPINELKGINTLSSVNLGKNYNDYQIANILRYYTKLYELLQEEI